MTSFRDRLEAVLSRLADPVDPAGQVDEARRAFVSVDAHRARRALDVDGRVLSGVLLSVKDLFDLEGEVTTAGSIARADLPRALTTAPAVARLIEHGAIVVGRTTMTELAYSGVGLNPHHGTPKNPFDRATGHVPGGSSAGAAVSVAEGVCDVALGTDTGGSIRIPAALCGLIGLKPTARRVSRQGVVPLSTSLDSVGPIAASLDVISLVDAVLAGEANPRAAVQRDRRDSLHGVTFAIADRYVLDDLDVHVARAFERALRTISLRGAKVVTRAFGVLDVLPSLQQRGGIAGYEAARSHASLLAEHRAKIDPRVVKRLEIGATISDDGYKALLQERAVFVRAFANALVGVDALLMPTCPIIAPTFDEVQTDEGFWRANRLLLRNPSLVNMADGCAITLPCNDPGEAPVGLTMCAPAMRDRALIALASALAPG